MQESLIVCARCRGNACHEASNDQLTVWSCFGCGFTANYIKILNLKMKKDYIGIQTV